MCVGVSHSLWLCTPAVPSLLSAVGPRGGTRQKATRSGIFVASKNNQLSRTHQSDPGVSYTIRSADAMQVVLFCQCHVPEVEKDVTDFSFFRSETFWGYLWSKLGICFTY